MTIAFGLLAVAALLLNSGLTKRKITDVIAGAPPGPDPQNPGEDPAVGAAVGSGATAADPLGGATTIGILGSSIGAKGVGTFDGKPVAKWIIPWLQKARQNGWKGTVTSGYRSFADQTRIYNSGVRPAAKPGTSNHEGSAFPRGAVDVTDAPQLSAILTRLHSPLKWAGSKDPVHFSHPHGGSY